MNNVFLSFGDVEVDNCTAEDSAGKRANPPPPLQSAGVDGNELASSICLNQRQTCNGGQSSPAGTRTPWPPGDGDIVAFNRFTLSLNPVDDPLFSVISPKRFLRRCARLLTPAVSTFLHSISASHARHYAKPPLTAALAITDGMTAFLA